MMVSDDMELSKGLGLPVLAMSNLGHMPPAEDARLSGWVLRGSLF